MKNIAVLEKLVVTPIVKYFLTGRERQWLLLFSQELDTGFYPERLDTDTD
jgi:hypothetical protein